MAGDIKGKYGTQVALTYTAINSMGGSATWVAGAGCLAVSNTTDLALDYMVSGKITWSSTAPASGAASYSLEVRTYGELNDTPDYPFDGSGNALGTDLARTFATVDDKLNSTNFLKSIGLAATANKVYTFPRIGIANTFNGPMPKFWGIWCSHGVTTASSTPAASGNTFWSLPVLEQYT